MDVFFAALSSPGPEIVRIGPLVIRWYGLLIAFSVLLGLNISNKLSLARGLQQNLINDLFPVVVLSALLGARIYYVLFEWRNYKYNLFEVFAIWKGGIAIHGALLAGFLAVLIFCRIRRQPFSDALDVMVPSIALGQAIGRWGNFFNNEAFGLPTELPWKLSIPYIYRPKELVDFDYFHPTFLYESFWNLFVFLLLIVLFYNSKKGLLKLPSGALSCIYLVSYSFGRFFIESLRTDPLCLGALPPFCEGGIRIAQLMSISLGLIGGFLLLRIYREKGSISDCIRKEDLQS